MLAEVREGMNLCLCVCVLPVACVFILSECVVSYADHYCDSVGPAFVWDFHAVLHLRGFD